MHATSQDDELARQKSHLKREQTVLRSVTKAYDELLAVTKQAAQSLKDINQTIMRKVNKQLDAQSPSSDTKSTATADDGAKSGDADDTDTGAKRDEAPRPSLNGRYEQLALRDRALRSKLSVSQHLLYARKLRLVAQLRQVYPIKMASNSKAMTISGLELPNTNLREFHKAGEECITAALGYVGHLVMMLGKYLETPLFFPVKTAGSRSTIHTSRRQFPLYRKGVSDLHEFEFAVKLLKRNIYQLLLGAGIQPPRGRHINCDGAGILSNLDFLMKRIFQ